MFRLHIACTAALLAVLASLAAAQDVPLPTNSPPPGNLAFVDGDVDLIREGAADRAAAGTLLVDGDLVRTANGRAEIVFADGTVLHLDHDTDIELLSPVRLRLSAGRVLIRVSAAATGPYVIDTPAASTRFHPRGEYGLSADRRYERLELTVTRGTAEIDPGGAPTLVRGGEMASILGAGGRVLLQTFNSARWDAFEIWSNDRVNGFSTAPSSRVLPPELRAYGPALDNYGRWDYIAPYGNVWFPAVGATWRPYYTGSWMLTRYGWTWIGNDPWSWPTHHFGRWGFTGAAWYWIPTRVWGPAWVSWSFVPGYVSWCPLGFDGRAVIGFSAASAWLGPRRPGDHPAYWPNDDPGPWRAWTIVPRDSFGGRRPVRAHAVDPMRLPEQTRRVIATAVPRGTVSVPAASRGVPSVDVAVPRGRAPIPPSAVRRDAQPPESRPRGGVRNPQATPPRATDNSRMYPGAPPVVYPAPAPPAATGAVERGAERGSERGVERGAERRMPPASREPGTGDEPRVYAPRPEQSRPPREDRPARRDAPESGGRARSGGVAVPRAQGESQPAPPPPTSAPAQGGARRRPPR